MIDQLEISTHAVTYQQSSIDRLVLFDVLCYIAWPAACLQTRCPGPHHPTETLAEYQIDWAWRVVPYRRVVAAHHPFVVFALDACERLVQPWDRLDEFHFFAFLRVAHHWHVEQTSIAVSLAILAHALLLVVVGLVLHLISVLLLVAFVWRHHSHCRPCLLFVSVPTICHDRLSHHDRTYLPWLALLVAFVLAVRLAIWKTLYPSAAQRYVRTTSARDCRRRTTTNHDDADDAFEVVSGSTTRRSNHVDNVGLCPRLARKRNHAFGVGERLKKRHHRAVLFRLGPTNHTCVWHQENVSWHPLHPTSRVVSVV